MPELKYKNLEIKKPWRQKQSTTSFPRDIYYIEPEWWTFIAIAHDNVLVFWSDSAGWVYKIAKTFHRLVYQETFGQPNFVRFKLLPGVQCNSPCIQHECLEKWLSTEQTRIHRKRLSDMKLLIKSFARGKVHKSQVHLLRTVSLYFAAKMFTDVEYYQDHHQVLAGTRNKRNIMRAHESNWSFSACWTKMYCDHLRWLAKKLMWWAHRSR